jgi:putative transferase (TIGR04331 family)
LEDIRVDHATRQKFRAYQTSDELTQLIVNTLSTNLPVCLLEGYHAIKKAIDSQLGDRVQPEVIVLGRTKGVPLRIWIASQAERGTILLGIQPGGLYGEGHYTAEDRLRRLTDRFITWGWKREEGDLPLPAIHLPQRTQRVRENGSVLWITREPASWTGPDAYEYGAPSSPRIHPRHFQERQDRFYAALDDRVKREVMCRPKPVGMTPSTRQALQERTPLAAIDDYAVSYRERAREARLVVVDHFGATTFLEALAMNVPVVMYSDLRGAEDKAFTMTELSTPYYRELHEVGIYHHGPESVADLINEIYSDVEQWWSAPTRQGAIDRFRNRFAHTTPDHTEQWISALCRIAAGPAARNLATNK